MALPHLTRVEYLPLGLILVVIFLSVVGQPFLPDFLPVQWNNLGEGILFIQTDLALYLGPGFILAVYIWLLKHGHQDPLRKNILVSYDAVYWMRTSTIIFLLGAYIFIIGAGNGVWRPAFNTFLTLGFSYLFYNFGRHLPALKRNYSFGIVTPWTLESNQTWRLTHQKAGQYFIAAAILNFGALLLPGWNFWVGLIFGVLAFAAARLLAYRQYSKEFPHGSI